MADRCYHDVCTTSERQILGDDFKFSPSFSSSFSLPTHTTSMKISKHLTLILATAGAASAYHRQSAASYGAPRSPTHRLVPSHEPQNNPPPTQTGVSQSSNDGFKTTTSPPRPTSTLSNFGTSPKRIGNLLPPKLNTTSTPVQTPPTAPGPIPTCANFSSRRVLSHRRPRGRS